MALPPLIWIDLETTGLDPVTCAILEIAIVVTDGDLRPLESPFTAVIWQPPNVLEAMNEWCKSTHGNSGLLAEVATSTSFLESVAQQVLNYLRAIGCEPGKSPICGNTISFDRSFLRAHMPSIDSFAHYRSIDVTGVSEALHRWSDTAMPRKNTSNHRALPDILASIDQLAECRQFITNGCVKPGPR